VFYAFTFVLGLCNKHLLT